MQLPMFQVDAFATGPFRGNPAAVVPLHAWLPDETLLAITRKNNLAQTAFFVPLPDDPDADFHLRWMAPAIEVALCGHATLATGHALRTHLGVTASRITFRTMSGGVAVEVDEDRLSLDFPRIDPSPRAPIPALAAALGASPVQWLETGDVGGREGYLLGVFASRRDIEALTPDFLAMAEHGAITVTAPGSPDDDCDFVSRFFGPGYGIDEDHATGSIHAMLTPYWHARLGCERMFARQLSPRGAAMWVQHAGERVRIAGHCTTSMQGTITVE
ncbi:MAG: PhzF family phenazine biosynthesis protein [Planctomycetota bacterium]